MSRETTTNERLDRAFYEKELRRLQTQLTHLQGWVKAQGVRAVVVFEGRDAAGKGGVIKRITERVSPRVFRTVALPAPSDRERSQLFMQRYIEHFPAAGEIVLFDRSWYNRAGVETVMGFCSPEQTTGFLEAAPLFERHLIQQGIVLIKYFFDVNQQEQQRRFRRRIDDPMRRWKLSPMDIESYRRWWEYTKAYQRMLTATDTEWAPWHRVAADDKRRARLNCIAHLLSRFEYTPQAFTAPVLGDRDPRPHGTPEELSFSSEVPQRY